MKRCLILVLILLAVVAVVASVRAQAGIAPLQVCPPNCDVGDPLVEWQAVPILTFLPPGPDGQIRWIAHSDAQFVVGRDGHLYAITPVVRHLPMTPEADAR